MPAVSPLVALLTLRPHLLHHHLLASPAQCAALPPSLRLLAVVVVAMTDVEPSTHDSAMPSDTHVDTVSAVEGKNSAAAAPLDAQVAAAVAPSAHALQSQWLPACSSSCPTCNWHPLYTCGASTHSACLGSTCVRLELLARRVACLAHRQAAASAQALDTAVPLLERLADMHVRVSAVVVLAGLSLLWRACSSSPALAAELAFTSSAVKLSAQFLLLYATLHWPLLRPNRTRVFTQEEAEVVRRRAAFVLCVLEVVQFALMTHILPTTAAATAPASAGGGRSKPLASSDLAPCRLTSCLVWMFVNCVYVLHSLALAVVLGAVSAVAADGDLRGSWANWRERANEQLATLPSPCAVLARVVNGVCAPTADGYSASASTSTLTAAAPSSNRRVASGRTSPVPPPPPPPSVCNAAASSTGAIVAPAAPATVLHAIEAGSSAQEPSRRRRCRRTPSPPVLEHARQLVVCIGAAAVQLGRHAQQSIYQLTGGEELNASPAERARQTAEQQQPPQESLQQQQEPPSGRSSLEHTMPSLRPLSPVLEFASPSSGTATAAVPVSPVASPSASPAALSSAAADAPSVSAAKASLPLPASPAPASPLAPPAAAAAVSASLSPDAQSASADGFELIEHSELRLLQDDE